MVIDGRDNARTSERKRETIVSVSQLFKVRKVAPPQEKGRSQGSQEKNQRNGKDTHDGGCQVAVNVTLLWRVPARNFQKLLLEVCSSTMRKNKRDRKDRQSCS
jgi:hypothetical protein